MLKRKIENYIERSMDGLEVNVELKKKLKQKLFPQQARKKHFLFTLFNINTMKRYSLSYLAGFAILTLVITTILPQQINPLSPEEVLAKALENYEQLETEEGIYHQKILSESYENNLLTHSEVNEWFSIASANSFDLPVKNLQIVKNTAEDKIDFVELSLRDEFGDTTMYSNQPHSKYYRPLKELEKDWLEIFKGEKIYCVEKIDSVSEAFEDIQIDLIIAADDYSVYQLDGGAHASQDFSQMSPQDQDIAKIMDFQHPQLIAEHLKTLIETGEYEYSQIEEGDREFYFFKIPQPDQGSFGFYVDPETYRLTAWEIEYGGNDFPAKDKFTLLENEYLPLSESSSIFDPNQFTDLVEVYSISNFALPFAAEKNGCFDREGKTLNNFHFEDLPESLRQEWQTMIDGLRGEIKGWQDNMENSLKSSFSMHPNMPSLGFVSQGYNNLHEGWDFALAENGEDGVYSPKAGRVTEVVTKDWNEGKGNTIKITHQMGDKTFETIYQHLADNIKVQVGDWVEENQLIGHMGNTGSTVGKGVTLHFGVLVDGEPVDPNLLWEE